jgi:hypothetical protein
VLVALGLAVAVPAAAQTDPPRLAVTSTSDHCEGGVPVVDYTVANQEPTPVAVQVWWVADASVYGIVGTDKLGAAPDRATGSFALPYDFYTGVTVYATATWPDGQPTTNASWAIPVADCSGSAPSTTLVEPTTTTVDDGKVKDDKDDKVKDDKDVPTTTVGIG